MNEVKSQNPAIEKVITIQEEKCKETDYIKEQSPSPEQYNQILKELREIKQILATKKDIKKIEKKENREIKENMATKKDNEDNRKIKDIVENIGDITDRICERIDSMCHKMNEAILEAYGMPISPQRRYRNVTRPIYYGEDGINSTRARSADYIY